MASTPRILLLGASGQVGQELQRSFAGLGEMTVPDRHAGDLSHEDRLRALVRAVRPTMILNAAAYTAVDKAEQEKELAYAINAHAPGVLAEEALREGALLVHYSTDYVFDGSKQEPWVETDATGPLNVYGATKLAGEQAIESVGGQYLIFRTSWVYGPHGKNFVLRMLQLGRERSKLSIVADQYGAPTTAIEIADATRRVVDAIRAGRCGTPAEWSGVYHMTCAHATTWFGFAQAIFNRAAKRLAAPHPELIPITTSEFPTPARRPAYSVLSNSKLDQRFGVRLAAWESALDVVIEELAAAQVTAAR